MNLANQAELLRVLNFLEKQYKRNSFLLKLDKGNMAFFSGKQAEDTCNIKKSRLINSHLEFLSSCEGSLAM